MVFNYGTDTKFTKPPRGYSTRARAKLSTKGRIFNSRCGPKIKSVSTFYSLSWISGKLQVGRTSNIFCFSNNHTGNVESGAYYFSTTWKLYCLFGRFFGIRFLFGYWYRIDGMNPFAIVDSAKLGKMDFFTRFHHFHSHRPYLFL